MNVLMIGATGKYASLLIPALKKRDVTIFALLQDADKEKEAINNGVDKTIIGDLNNPESLEKALHGVEGVFHINPAFAENEVAMGIAMVTAAKKAKVKKFVFSSVYHPSLSLINHSAKRPVEEALYNSGMTFTVLQPAIYMQNFDMGWAGIRKSKKLLLPYSAAAKMCYVDYREVAEVAALAFTEDKLMNGTFELCSQGLYSGEEIAAFMSKSIGETIEAQTLSTEEWLHNAHIPDGLLKKGLLAMNKEYDKHGFSGGNALVLQTILGRKETSVEDYIIALGNDIQLVHNV
ncbi:MAG: NmrA family NAD(P)-binding protein [Gloeobacteraceae cyanobacterium ES-bin-316]|nr:NmrA family NAD(P)-binding protein [Ferruginibacter sp.]